MSSYYKYELWNGKRVVGFYYSLSVLQGSFLRVYKYYSALKVPYGAKDSYFDVPLVTRMVHSTGPDTLYRVVLDIRRKGPKQIAKLQGSQGPLT